MDLQLYGCFLSSNEILLGYYYFWELLNVFFLTISVKKTRSLLIRDGVIFPFYFIF